MQLARVVIILLILCVLGIAVNGQDTEEDASQVERHDIHRIVLKPEKSRKQKKRAKPKPTRSPLYQDNIFELPSHTSQPARYQHNPIIDQYPSYDDFRDLVKPRPPAVRQETLLYPEEDFSYREAASSNRQNFVQKPQNSDWNPIPSTLLTYDYHHYPTNNVDMTTTTPTSATKTVTSKRSRNRQTKQRRRPDPNIFMTTTSTTSSTTPKSIPFPSYHHYSTQSPKTFQSKPKSNATHYVNYNHNNKSHIKYEVSTNTKPKKFASSFVPGPIQFPAPPKTVQHSPATKTSFSNLSNSYEVYETAKDYNKQIKQTRTLIPQPVFPPFVPTISSYTIPEKTTKRWM